MEWATQWHGPEGKVHADKRTVEYTGRGNHSADAVSFVGAISVGQNHAARARDEQRDRLWHAPCLVTPLDGAGIARGLSHDTADADTDVMSVTPAVCDADAVAETSTPGDSKKTKHRDHGNHGKASAARKKRRVGAKAQSSESDVDDARDVLRLPVYYFEVQVLATRHFQSDPGERDGSFSRPHASDRVDHGGSMSHNGNDAENDGTEDGNGDEGSEMNNGEDDEGESDDVAMDVDLMERAMYGDSTTAPWRGRARRLIHEHLRATASDIVPTAREHGSSSSSSGVEAVAARHDANGSDSAMDVDSVSNGDFAAQLRSLQQQTNGNGHGSTTNNRLVRSASSTLSPPSPPQLTHQQLLLSFPLSSSTIHQIRLRLERQHQQTQSQRRRYSSTETSEPGGRSLTSTISNIHARHRRDTVRRKRSNHRIAVGFMFSKHGGDYKRDICHDELGRQACGIALTGKTGAILSNGQLYLQTDMRFGYGDTVGCGVILDTRTFFWTVNGKLVAMLPVNDVHHLDDYEDHRVSDAKDTEWFTAWADQLLPAVSLHEHGECVRALFGETRTEHFRFDIDAFSQQQLKERQVALSAHASAKLRSGQAAVYRDEEQLMHKLIEDYFAHFGYGNALSALQNLHRGAHGDRRSREDASVAQRGAIRQLIYAFKTRDALLQLESMSGQVCGPDPTVLLHCRMLCVVDVLYKDKTMARKGSSTEAICTAQELLQDYLSGAEEHTDHVQEIREFLTVLLYPSMELIPKECAGRRFLLWNFREEVADALNDALSTDGSDSCALEKLVDDLSELQRECLSSGAPPFPLDEGSGHSSCSNSRQKRGRQHSKRRNSNRQLVDDSDDDNEDESNSSSSGESDDDDDDDDYDDDDE